MNLDETTSDETPCSHERYIYIVDPLGHVPTCSTWREPPWGMDKMVREASVPRPRFFGSIFLSTPFKAQAPNYVGTIKCRNTCSTRVEGPKMSKVKPFDWRGVSLFQKSQERNTAECHNQPIMRWKKGWPPGIFRACVKNSLGCETHGDDQWGSPRMMGLTVVGSPFNFPWNGLWGTVMIHHSYSEHFSVQWWFSLFLWI